MAGFAEIRKIQKVPTGFIFTFPKKFADRLELTGTELLKITCADTPDKLVIDIIRTDSVGE